MRRLKITKRVVAVFLVVFGLFTALDHYTTKVALGLGYQELNPFTDFSSTATLIIPEVAAATIGCVSIAFGMIFLGRHLFEQQHLCFKKFVSDLRSQMHWWIWLTVIGPLVVAFGRALVVLNNCGLIAFGWGFMEVPQRFIAAFLNLPVFISGVLVDAVFLALLVKPMMWVVWRATFSADDVPPVMSSGRV